ncbi:MAG TPA: formate dehydrogenase accessory sulfurtransferase FdhD [Vicinamibacterales bacterium]
MNDSPVRVAAVRRVGAPQAPADADADLVAVEEPLQLELEHGPRAARSRLNVGVVLRTPGRDEDLAAGLLFAEGFVGSARDIERMERPAAGHLSVSLAPEVVLDERLARRVLVRSSACGVCGRDAVDDLAGAGVAALPPGPAVPGRTLQSLPALLRARQAAFDDTGGLHAAALFDRDGTLLGCAEDVGRHNAVDKLIGAHLRASALPGLPSSLPSPLPVILLVSGRAAFEIAHKAVRARVPILAAVGAPSSLAVETARAFNLTLAGFVRHDRFNVYSGFDRIV